MPRRTRLVLPLLAALLLGLVAMSVSACGYSSDSKDVAEGEVVELGDLKYQVVFSRFLNANDNEDSAYLVGQPALPKGSSYFGVFLEVQNKSEDTQKLAESFTIKDADEQTYDAIPSESLYAFPFGGEVESQEPIPAPTRLRSKARSRAPWCSLSSPPAPRRTGAWPPATATRPPPR